MNSTIDFSLVEAENKFVVKSSNLSIRRQGLYPSEASVVDTAVDGKSIIRGNCMRASWYRAMGYKKTNPATHSLSMKGNLGKWAEIGTVEKWKEMGLWVANNIKFFDKDYAVSGELDAVLRCPDTEQHIGIEMKTFYGHYANQGICGAKGRKLKAGGYSGRTVGKPKIDHFLQAVYYAHFYINVLKKLDEYRLYYLERGDGHRVEFRVGAEKQEDGTHLCWWQQVPSDTWNAFEEEKVYQSFTVENIQERYSELLTALRKKELPAKDFEAIWDEDTVERMFTIEEVGKTKYDNYKKGKDTNLGDWHCSYCFYKDQCKEDEEHGN